MRPIRKIIVHTSATTADRDIGAAEIDTTHRARGFREIGYHIVIRRGGQEEKGRAEEKIGAHAQGQNSDSIGICLIGGANAQGHGEANYTQVQQTTLARVLLRLLKKYPGAEIIGHRDVPALKDCPSFDVAHWLETGEMIHPRNLK